MSKQKSQEELARDYIDWDVSYDPSKGYPAGEDIYYKCLKCDFLLASQPGECAGCSCGNLFIDWDWGRFSVRNHDDLRIVRLTPMPHVGH
jgi:hypothetical protein